MKIYRIQSHEGWRIHESKLANEYAKRRLFERDLEARLCARSGDRTFHGFSYVVQQEVDFKVTGSNPPINWRETLTCPYSSLFNRVRGCMHIFDTDCDPYQDDPIYIMEQTTSTYTYLKNNYLNVVGSEFLGSDIDSGSVVNGIRHEDITRLSFEDGSLKHILSFDVFEHVPDFIQGFRECHRVLSRGGNILWTVPFIRQHRENTIRARMRPDGSVEHIMEPEYHGDPVNRKGVLCFYHFGWELLEQVKSIGFREVYACLFWSDVFGYLGPESIVLVAHK